MNDANESELDTAEMTSRYLMGNYGRFPVAFSRGEGAWLWDETGKRYLDFGMGIAVCSLGHCHPVIRRALSEQGGKLIHCSNLYRVREQAELARFVVEKVMRRPGRVFFCNSGAEANDALIKLARKFGHDTAGANDGVARHEIVTCVNSFHGRTLGGIAATGQEKVKTGFDPALPGFTHVPFNDCGALRAAVGPRTAAILFEAVQGEGGIHVASPEFFRTADELRREHNLLVMMDEVQCGLGRTGDWCGWETALRGGGVDFAPDAVSWAKGFGGGFPIGAIWAGERPLSVEPDAPRLCEVLGPGTHGSTFGGTPLASAVGLAVLEEIARDELWRNAERLGRDIREAVRGWRHPLVAELRGLGLMIGFVLDESRIEENADFRASGRTPAAHVVTKLMEAGLIAVPAGQRVVRWLPALNVSDDEVGEALAIQRRVLDALAG